MKEHTQGNHPNSLKNLKPIRDPEMAREMQRKSAISRKTNAAVARRLNKSIQEWNKMKDKLKMDDAPSALEFLKYRMLELMEEGKMMEAQELAKELVEFETPKLSRVVQTNHNYDMDDISDEELDAELEKFRIVENK